MHAFIVGDYISLQILYEADLVICHGHDGQFVHHVKISLRMDCVRILHSHRYKSIYPGFKIELPYRPVHPPMGT